MKDRIFNNKKVLKVLRDRFKFRQHNIRVKEETVIRDKEIKE
jgi:hypothetical protein